MVRHYIQTVFRTLNKQKLNSGINILGLSLGLAISLLIWIFVLHQLSYDQFFDDYQRIYRIHSIVSVGQGEPQTVPATVFPLGEIAYHNFPEVDNFLRFTPSFSNADVVLDGRVVTIPGIIYADSTFFSFYNLSFIAGNPRNALSDITSMVLSQTVATRLFTDPLMAVNSVITIREQTYRITGVFEDLPENTHLSFSAICRHENLPAMVKDSGTNFYTYLKTSPGADIKTLEAKLDQAVADHIKSNPLYEGLPFVITNQMMNIADIHMHSDLVFEMKANGSYRSILIYSVLAVFILFMAIINYVNLATARSTLRSKEIGMRKVVGASRNGLIRQIILESMIITLISFLLAFAVAEVFSGVFSQAFGVTFDTTLLLTVEGLIVILSILIFTGLLSGLYPAFFMASFDAVKILKGVAVKGTRGRLFRRSLVIFQFAITIFIISSLLVISRQLQYIQTQNLGFSQQQVMLIRNVSSGIRNSFPEMLARLETLPRVQKAGGANFIYGSVNRIDLIAQQGVSKESGVSADILVIDDNFLEVMEINITQGRNFFPGSEPDLEGAFILNQTAAKALALHDPLNTQLDLFGRQGPLVGITGDFHLKSLHQAIEPVVMTFTQRGLPHVYLKVSAGDFIQLQNEITAVFNEFDPDHIPDIIFLDERIQNLYNQEQNQATLLSTGAILAIIISILGVYGLASFSAERRTKEIGIRKVLGTTTGQLLWLFNKESIILVGIAFGLAAPLAWMVMTRWLDTFTVQTPLNPLWFILPGILTLILSSATISLQAWRTSLANPVKSLRSE